MKLSIQLILFVGMAVLYVGCATIVRGGSQKVTINSGSGQSEAITVITKSSEGTVMSSNSGQVPMMMKVKRPSFGNEPYTLVIQREGMADQMVTFTKEFGWGWSIVGNMFNGTALWWGLLIDAATGAMWILKPDTITLSDKGAQESFFQKSSQLAHQSQNGALQIFLYDDPEAIASLIQDGQKPIGYLQKVPASK